MNKTETFQVGALVLCVITMAWCIFAIERERALGAQVSLQELWTEPEHYAGQKIRVTGCLNENRRRDKRCTEQAMAIDVPELGIKNFIVKPAVFKTARTFLLHDIEPISVTHEEIVVSGDEFYFAYPGRSIKQLVKQFHGKAVTCTYGFWGRKKFARPHVTVTVFSPPIGDSGYIGKAEVTGIWQTRYDGDPKDPRNYELVISPASNPSIPL